MPQFFSSSTPTTSYILNMNGSSKPSFQLAIKGSGAVSAEAVVEGSHDGQGWIQVVSMKASGSAYATDGGPVETNWPLLRARLTAVSGGTSTLHYSL